MGPNAPQLVFVLNSMMEPLGHLGRHADAITRGERALALIDATYGKDSPRRARVLGNLASTYGWAGDDKRARQIEEEVLAITIATAPGTVEEANAHINLASSLDDLGDPTAAIPHFERAKEIYTNLLGLEAPELASVFGGLADAHDKLGRHAEALAHTERALAIREATSTPPGHLAYARFHVALALDANGQRARAVAMARRALELPLGDTGREADLAKQIRTWLATHR
jgi:serine/threonine-protein kinase